MITTINEFRKLYENNYPEGDFIKYNYNDTPDVEEYMNQAASAMGEMTDSLYWFETQELEEIPGIMKDITGDESYDFDKVESYSTKQGTVKLYISSGDTGSYFIICNMNMNGKKIVDDQIVNSFDEFDNSQSEYLGDLDNSQDERIGDDDIDPAGGRGLASHESRKTIKHNMITTINQFKKINESSDRPFTPEEQEQIFNICNNSDRYSNGEFTAPNEFQFDFNIGDAMTQNVETYLLVKKSFGVELYSMDDNSTVDPNITTLQGFANWFNETEDDSDMDDYYEQNEGKSNFSRQLLNIKMTLQNLMKESEGNSAVIIELNSAIKQIEKLNVTIFKNLVNEGAVKRHWEEINNAIQAKLPLKYKSGENFGEAVPTLYTNNVVTFDNGINVIDMYIQTEVNKINESISVPLIWQDSSDGNGELIADGVANFEGFKNRYVIYPYGQQFILQVNGKNKSRGPLKLVKAAAQDVEKLVKTF